MKVNDYLVGAPVEAQELADAANPLLRSELLIDAQITRILVDAMSGTVGVLLELREAPHLRTSALRATSALLRVTGVAQQSWICTGADVFTAWSITGATVHQHMREFHLVAHCVPAGALRIVGASAEFILLKAAGPTCTPPDDWADARELIRFGVVDENTECEPVGMARSMHDARV